MRPLNQIQKKMKFLMQYLFFYLLGTFLIVYIFALLYIQKGVTSPFRLSFEIFWSIESEYPELIKTIAYCETIAYDLFSIILVGTVLVRLLQPLNPIQFSNYIVYDTVDRKMTFRYWIMLPKGKYLYDVKLKILLTDYESHQTGINQLETFWEPDNNKMNLDQIRGIRFVELNEKESSDLIILIERMIQKHINDKGEYIGGNCAVDFSIRGTSENGTTYYGWHRYKLEEILLGYRYVPLQRHTYASEDFYRIEPRGDKGGINASKDFYEKGKKEFFRYQHFDKVYRLPNSAFSSLAQKRGDILSKEQILHGQYSGIKQLLLDLISFGVWFYLDSDKKIRWIFHKAFEYFLHITHIRRY